MPVGADCDRLALWAKSHLLIHAATDLASQHRCVLIIRGKASAASSAHACARQALSREKPLRRFSGPLELLEATVQSHRLHSLSSASVVIQPALASAGDQYAVLLRSSRAIALMDTRTELTVRPCLLDAACAGLSRPDTCAACRPSQSRRHTYTASRQPGQWATGKWRCAQAARSC